MIDVTLDADNFSRQLTNLEKKQMPFAVMKALNSTGTDVQGAQRKGIKGRFTLRRETFILNTVKIERGNFATKNNLRTIINIDENRNVLAKFEKGGQKSPREGSSIAIPVAARRNKSDIVTKGNRPKAYQLQDVRASAGNRVAKGIKRTFMIRKSDGEGGIFQRVGRGKRSTIRELFTFKRTVPIPKSLGFQATALATARTRWPVNMKMWLERAIRTAR